MGKVLVLLVWRVFTVVVDSHFTAAVRAGEMVDLTASVVMPGSE
jgi:acyl-CoA hydrolase